LVLTSLKRTNSHALVCGSTDWRKIATDHNTRQRYNALLLAATEDEDDMPYELFNDAIKQAGKETATLVKSQNDDWFQFSRDDLVPCIEEQNEILHALCSSADLPPSIADTMRTSLQ